jgi:hypothetical protein
VLLLLVSSWLCLLVWRHVIDAVDENIVVGYLAGLDVGFADTFADLAVAYNARVILANVG